VLGLSLALVVEVALLIVKTNKPESPEERYPHLFDKGRWGRGASPGVSGGAGGASSSSSAYSGVAAGGRGGQPELHGTSRLQGGGGKGVDELAGGTGRGAGHTGKDKVA